MKGTPRLQPIAKRLTTTHLTKSEATQQYAPQYQITA